MPTGRSSAAEATTAADGAAGHGLAEVERGDVALGVVHAPAHVGVDREERVRDPDLAGGEVAVGDLRGAEVVVGRPSLRAADELDLGADGLWHGVSRLLRTFL